MARKKSAETAASAAPTESSGNGHFIILEAVPDSFILEHKMTGSYSVASPGVMKNDLPNTGPMAKPANPLASAGTVSLSTTGGFTFSHTDTAFTGTVTFQYFLQMFSGQTSSPATVTLKIVNHPPEAADDCYVLIGAGPHTVPSSDGVLKNDFDCNGVTIFSELWQDAQQGSVSLNPNGGFTYTVTPGNDPTTDFFTYRARDPANEYSQPATVTLKFI